MFLKVCSLMRLDLKAIMTISSGKESTNKVAREIWKIPSLSTLNQILIGNKIPDDQALIPLKTFCQTN